MTVLGALALSLLTTMVPSASLADALTLAAEMVEMQVMVEIANPRLHTNTD